jgi:hypothetical protein
MERARLPKGRKLQLYFAIEVGSRARRLERARLHARSCRIRERRDVRYLLTADAAVVLREVEVLPKGPREPGPRQTTNVWRRSGTHRPAPPLGTSCGSSCLLGRFVRAHGVQCRPVRTACACAVCVCRGVLAACMCCGAWHVCRPVCAAYACCSTWGLSTSASGSIGASRCGLGGGHHRAVRPGLSALTLEAAGHSRDGGRVSCRPHSQRRTCPRC